MNTLQLVRWLEKHLAEEQHSPHLRNQVNRFVWSLLASLIASLTASNGHVSWSTLWSLLPGSFWVAAEQTWPTIRWAKVQEYLRAAAQPPIVPPLAPPTLPAAAPQAGSPGETAQTPESRP